MNANKNATSKKSGKSGWLVGGVLTLAAAVAITFAVRSAPAKPAVEPPSGAQTVPNAAANQRELDYLRVLGADVPPAAPAAANQRALDYLVALGANIPQPHRAINTAQAMAAAANQRALDYLRALGANVPLGAHGQTNRTQAAPDVANQHALDYLRALGANIP